MPFRATFDCLWCGARHTCRGGSDIEGWAQLCPDCVGRAGDNGFLRFRLHRALAERGAVTAPSIPAAPSTPPPPAPTHAVPSVPMEADAEDPDDRLLRRGRHEHGPIHDAAWNAELDAAGRWLDAQPLAGEIVELGAGTGWWSPLLADKGELWVYDASDARLERARDRLVAHRLRAHLHVHDEDAPPDRAVDALFTGFWLGSAGPDSLGPRMESAAAWLKPGGVWVFLDALADPRSSAAAPLTATTEDLEAAMRDAGLRDVEIITTGRFFVLGRARR